MRWKYYTMVHHGHLMQMPLSSLTALGLVFVGLSQREQINLSYRNYKLTRILKPLLQDGKVAIICCINPSSAYSKTTEYTLKFAERAKKVKTTKVRNVEQVQNKTATISNLRLELEEKKMENDQLKDELVKVSEIVLVLVWLTLAHFSTFTHISTSL
jgi:hypothetical protein